MSTLHLSKTERIDVRASSSVKQLLQEAARSCHKSVSEFLLDAGVTAANQALADRRHFVLNDEQWQAFQQALDRPVQAKPRLKKPGKQKDTHFVLAGLSLCTTLHPPPAPIGPGKDRRHDTAPLHPRQP